MNIDLALVKQLIKSQFPQWSGLPITPVKSVGWDNRTFKEYLGEGVVFKMAKKTCMGAWGHCSR